MAWAIAVKNGKHSERRGDDEESDKEEILIASAIFMAFVSTVFAGCYYDRTITGVIIAICTAITATMIATGATTVIIAGMITGIETIGLAGTA